METVLAALISISGSVVGNEITRYITKVRSALITEENLRKLMEENAEIKEAVEKLKVEVQKPQYKNVFKDKSTNKKITINTGNTFNDIQTLNM